MAPASFHPKPHNSLNGLNGDQDGFDTVGGIYSATPSAASSSLGAGFGDSALEPIAIVGYSLNFPGEAKAPDALWKVLAEKRSAMTEWPKDRVNIDAFHHPDSSRPDTVFKLPYKAFVYMLTDSV
jgi:hypothetical protein